MTKAAPCRGAAAECVRGGVQQRDLGRARQPPRGVLTMPSPQLNSSGRPGVEQLYGVGR